MLETSYFKHETTGVNVLQMFFFVADSFPFFARYLITFYCIVLLLQAATFLNTLSLSLCAYPSLTLGRCAFYP